MGKMKKIAAIAMAMTMLCTTEAHAAAAYMDDVSSSAAWTLREQTEQAGSTMYIW